MRKSSALLVTLCLIHAGCSTNPATGKREFNIVSESQALAMGAQAHQQIIQEFGVYNEVPALNEMVTKMGRGLAAASDRPNLPWNFTILDAPMVNAMALPGGYIYVTRGILERMNSQDELAGVIAHEIAHVSARHAEQRMSQSQLAQFGLVIGSVLAGPAAAQAYGGLAELGATLLFQRYSRQQETHADVLGTAYMTEAGYNPHGAENMLLVLQRLDRGESSPLDRYFIDHPDPRKRVADVRGKIASLQQSSPAIGSAPLDRDTFVRKLDGIIVGASTLETTVTDEAVFQRRTGMIVPIPSGWQAVVPPGALFQMAPRKSRGTGLIVQQVPLIKLQGGGNVQQAVRGALQQNRLTYQGSTNAASRSGERFTVDIWSGRTSNGVVRVESTQFAMGDQAVIFLFINERPERNRSELATVLDSMTFDRQRARSAEPARMKVGPPRANEDWASVASRATGNREDATEVANINGFDVSTPFPRNVLLKLPADVIANEE